MLQTAAYMCAVFSDRGDLSGENRACSVAARNARGEILALGRSYTLVMAEGALAG